MTEFMVCTRDRLLRAAVQDPVEYRTHPTLTIMTSGGSDTFVDETGIPVVLPSKWFFETMTPAKYDDMMAASIGHSFQDLAAGFHVPPMNERAALTILAIDVDEDDVPMHEMIAYGRLIQNAASVHFGLKTAFLLAARLTAKKELKYHLFFPQIVMVDTHLWTVLRKIVAPFEKATGSKKKVDTAPMFGRNLRLHGSERTTGDVSGVYQVVYACDWTGAGLNESDCNLLVSIRPSAPMLAAWMMDPVPKVKTSVAAEFAKAPTTGVSIFTAAMVLDDERESIRRILASDRAKGMWLLAEVKRRCVHCADQTLCRVLYRIYDTTVFRWCLCPGCNDLCSLKPAKFNVDEAGEVGHCWPNLTVAEGVQYDVRRALSIMDLPLELVCINGFSADGEVDISRVCNSEYATTVSGLADLMGSTRPFRTTNINLTAANCGGTNDQLPRLATGIASVGGLPDPVESGAHQIVTLQAPCGSGKTMAIMPMIERASKVLVVAPRRSLTTELSSRIAALVPSKRVVNYQEVQREHVSSIFATADVFVVTPESLPRFVMQGPGHTQNFNAPLLIIDELCTVVKTVYDSNTTSNNRANIQRALLAVMTYADRVVCLDKDIGYGERLFLAAVLRHAQTAVWPVVPGQYRVGPPPFELVHVKLADEVKRVLVMWPDMPSIVRDINDKLAGGGSVAVFCAHKEDAFTIAEHVRANHPELSQTLMTGSSTDEEKSAFSQAPNDVLAASDTKVLIYTTTIGVGVSIDDHRFTDIYVILGSALTWRDALQGEARVRKIEGQDLWRREINVYSNNVSINETATKYTMPTIGTAFITAQAQVTSSGVIRAGSAFLEGHEFDVNGALRLEISPLAIVDVVTKAIAELERRWQMHFLFDWANGHELVFKESVKEKEVVDELAEARKTGKELRRTQDLLDDDDGHETAKNKRRRVTDVVGARGLEEVDGLAKDIQFVEWVKSHKPCLGVWRGVHELMSRRAGLSNVGSVVGGVETMSKSVTGPALLCMAAATLSGSTSVFAGQTVVQYACVDAEVISPLDGQSKWTADRFFGWLGEVAVGKVDCAATNGVKAQLRAFTKPFTVAPEATDAHKQVARAKYAYNLTRALLGGKLAMAEPGKVIGWVRMHCDDSTMFS